MEGQYYGPMSIDDFFQALFQDRQFFTAHGITRINNATLYFHPCDEHGRPVIVRNKRGRPIDGYTSPGAYHAAADFYDAQSLEPKITTSDDPPPPSDVPFSPL